MQGSLLFRSIAAFLASVTPLYGSEAAPMPQAAVTAASPTAEAEPKPEPAERAVLAAFRGYPIVALGMSHQLQDELDFALSVIRDPEFPTRVNAIVLECGNPLYQDDMDRYVAGQDVPLQRLQLFWRNTTQPALCAAGRPKDLVDLVRRINSHEPAKQRIRLLGGDAPIDWDKVHTAADIAPFFDRDPYFASVIEREVLAKHQRALLIIGTGHVLKRPAAPAAQESRSPPTLTSLIERDYPHSVFVVQPHAGFGNRTSELEPRLANWPVPSLAFVRDTWLGRLDSAAVFADKLLRIGSDPNEPPNPFAGVALQDLVDGYLYLGPAASLRQADLTVRPDPTYAAELNRRIRLISSFDVPLSAKGPGRPRSVQKIPLSH